MDALDVVVTAQVSVTSVQQDERRLRWEVHVHCIHGPSRDS